MVSTVSEGGRFIHGSRAFMTSWLLLPSLFPLGEVFSAVHSVLLVVSKCVPFHLPTSLRLRRVCLQVVWLKTSSCERKSFELSVQSPTHTLGRRFLIRDNNKHSFEKNGHPLLSVRALDFVLRCHGDADITKLDIALFLPTPGSCQLPVSFHPSP